MAATLVDFLEESAQKFGDRPAMFFKPGFRYQRWSYWDMWEQSGRVATLLQRQGVKEGERALLWGPNSPFWVLAFFGCVRAGVIAVPLDVRSSEEFVDKVQEKSRPSIAFVSRFTPSAGEHLGVPLVRFEDVGELIAGLPEPKPVKVARDDVAEIMFTSGTTGDPKGVMLSHGNILSDLDAVREYIPGKPSYRLVSLLPLSHTFEQIGGLFLAFACGASVTYPVSRQPSILFKTMQERKVTTLLLVPQGLELFMNGIEREVKRQGKERVWRTMLRVAERLPFPLRRRLFRRVHKRFGGHLEFIVSGGAALDPEIGHKWELLGVKILQGYGATEASPVISFHPLAKARYDSVGLPLPGVEVRIVEDGEVWVRGPNIMKGYWEAPEQTAAVLEDGWYKTGDIGYFDKEGFLHLNGRKKDMIVLSNGQNVFPDDIEVVLRKHEAVKDCAVVGLPKGAGVEVHAALVLMDVVDESAAGAAVTWANGRLADHQRIQGFTRWPEDDLPRTHTLKIKKNVIIDVLQGDRKTESPQAGMPVATGPRGVQSIIAEVAGQPLAEVPPDKTLSDLGLDSLGRVELLSAIEDELGAFVDENRVGPDTTVAELEKLIVEAGQAQVQVRFAQWGMAPWTRIARGAIQRLVIFPMLRAAYKLEVAGLEHLVGVRQPVLYAANHHLHLDNVLILKALPVPIRRRFAIAAAADLFDSRVWGILNPLLGNGFPFAKEGPIRPSLENLGRVLDNGWSVLLYPEGELTIGGPMKPFKGGTGLLAVESGLAVVPVKVRVDRLGFPWFYPALRRGRVRVSFGPPLTFAPNTSYLEATDKIEAAVKAL